MPVELDSYERSCSALGAAFAMRVSPQSADELSAYPAVKNMPPYSAMSQMWLAPLHVERATHVPSSSRRKTCPTFGSYSFLSTAPAQRRPSENVLKSLIMSVPAVNSFVTDPVAGSMAKTGTGPLFAPQSPPAQ